MEVTEPDSIDDEYTASWNNILITPWKIEGHQILTDDDVRVLVARVFKDDVAKHIVELHNWWLNHPSRQEQLLKERRRCEHRQCTGSHQCKLRRG